MISKSKVFRGIFQWSDRVLWGKLRYIHVEGPKTDQLTSPEISGWSVADLIQGTVIATRLAKIAAKHDGSDCTDGLAGHRDGKVTRPGRTAIQCIQLKIESAAVVQPLRGRIAAPLLGIRQEDERGGIDRGIFGLGNRVVGIHRARGIGGIRGEGVAGGIIYAALRGAADTARRRYVDNSCAAGSGRW